MAGQSWDLLQQADEDALHNISRLLSIESRPYQRISGRLLKPDALDNTRPLYLPSPPPDASAADEKAAAWAAEQERQIQDVRSWENDILNEISLFDYAILRMELTTNSNQVERERYAEEKVAITGKQQSVRESIEELRDNLKEAQENLAVRKTYDELTEKITSSKMLKPRDEQAAAHAKLDEEIAELQQEVENSKDTWAERRIQFGRIEEESKEMLRMIKDEKEEAERKEGMMKDDHDADEGEGSTTRGVVSQAGTPRPDAGGATPMHPGSGDDGSQSQTLRLPQDRLAPFSRNASAAPSPGRSEVEDDKMAESGDAHADDSSGMEEGEEEDDGPPEDMKF